MTASLSLLLLSIFSLTLFAGCTTKAQPLACFKGSASCYTKQNINTHETIETTVCDTQTACTDCFAIIL